MNSNGTIRITIVNIALVTAMSFLGITVAKLFLAKFYINGLSEAVATG